MRCELLPSNPPPRSLAFALAFTLAGAAGCTTDVTVYGPDDPFWGDGYTHDDYEESGDPVGSLETSGATVDAVMHTGACSTVVVRGLAEQLVEEVECMLPGAYARVDGKPGVSIGSSVFPYLQKPAADALGRVSAAHALTVTSAVRTVAQQYVLYGWYRNGRCTSVVSLAAPPGRSNHESGLAVDVSNYGAVRSAMGAQGFAWLGSSDPVHFDYHGSDLRSRSVLAFQRLWNRNNPGARISEDGAYGPQTEGVLKRSPAAGFPIGSPCGAVPGNGARRAIAVSWIRGDAGDYQLVADDDARPVDADDALGGGLVAETPDGVLTIAQKDRRLYEIAVDDPGVAAIEVRVDGVLLTDLDTGLARSPRAAVRAMFNLTGPRRFEVTTFGDDGAPRATIARDFTIE